MGRITDWLERNDQRIFLVSFFIAIGYYGAGFWGAISQIVLFGSVIALSILKPLQRLKALSVRMESTEDSALGTDRLVFVRVQEPHALLVPLRAGGRMIAMAWQDVAGARYETYPEEALERALVEYKGKKISHYVEQNADVEIDEPLKEIDEEEWIEVVPERDFPQEEE